MLRMLGFGLMHVDGAFCVLTCSAGLLQVPHSSRTWHCAAIAIRLVNMRDEVEKLAIFGKEEI